MWRPGMYVQYIVFRPQKQRPNYIVGISNELYTNQLSRRYGWIPNMGLLSQLNEAVKDDDR